MKIYARQNVFENIHSTLFLRAKGANHLGVHHQQDGPTGVDVQWGNLQRQGSDLTQAPQTLHMK